MTPRHRRLYKPTTFAAPQIVAEASNWASSAAAAGGSVSNSTLIAVSNFVTDCKNAGVWTKLKRVNLFCGNNLAACLVPLKVGGGLAVDQNFNFVSGDYSESTGLKGDAASKYLNTGINPSAVLTLGDTHLSIYNRSSTPSVSGFGGDNTSAAVFGLHHPWSDGVFYSDQGNSSTARLGVAITGPFGYLIGTRSGSDQRSFRNGVQIGTLTASGGALPSNTTAVFAHNNGGSAPACSNYFIGGYTIGTGLTPAQAAALSSAMETFQDALGRGVA